MLKLTIIEDFGMLKKDDVVEYLGHIVGGWVKIKFEEQVIIIPPHITKELS
jgi:hypothetical protein